jgi:hypothetical protein
MGEIGVMKEGLKCRLPRAGKITYAFLDKQSDSAMTGKNGLTCVWKLLAPHNDTIYVNLYEPMTAAKAFSPRGNSDAGTSQKHVNRRHFIVKLAEPWVISQDLQPKDEIKWCSHPSFCHGRRTQRKN